MTPINEYQREFAKQKIQKAKHYLNHNFIETGNAKVIPLSAFYKSPIINTNRYVAEIQHRAGSICDYAEYRNLTNIFVTLTLPSEYHSKKTIKLRNGKTKLVNNPKHINDEAHNPKNGSFKLSKMLKKIFDDVAYKSIAKDDRCYFRVTEPHKDGTPHMHISFFVPDECVEKLIKVINRKFPSPQSKIEIDINNPKAYLMKYVLKTLDDMRYDKDNISDLSLWYIYHGIGRFYTSRTFISLDIYRVLGGKYTLNALSTMYKNKDLTVYLSVESNKVHEILENGFPIYQKGVIKKLDSNKSILTKLIPTKKPKKSTLIEDYYENEISLNEFTFDDIPYEDLIDDDFSYGDYPHLGVDHEY